MKKCVFMFLLLVFTTVGATGLDVSFTPGSQHFPGFITAYLHTAPTAVMVYTDDGTPPTGDTYETRGNIIFFDVFEDIGTVNIPVPEGDFIIKIGAETTKIATINVRKIVEYVLPSGITVIEGAPLPSLPSQIDATFDDGSHVNVPVIWTTSEYNPFPGTYMMYGKITGYPLIAGLTQPTIVITVRTPSGSTSGGGIGGGGGSAQPKETPSEEPLEMSGLILPGKTSRTVSFKIGESRFLLDEDIYMMDTPIMYDAKGDRTLFPVRFLPTALGYNVEWNPDEYKVTISSSAQTVQLNIGSNILYINNVPTVMDTPAIINNNRTYIPLRYVAEALGFNVAFNQENQVVTLTERD